MLENGGVSALLRSEVAGELGQVLLVGSLLLVLGQVLARPEFAPQRLVSEPPNDVAKLLWVLVQYWLLADQRRVERLQVRAGARCREAQGVLLLIGRRVAVFVILSDRAAVLCPLFLSKAADVGSRLVRSPRNRGVLYCAGHATFLYVVAAGAYIFLSEGLGEMVLAHTLAVRPLDCSAWRSRDHLARLVHIVGAWTQSTAIIGETGHPCDKYTLDRTIATVLESLCLESLRRGQTTIEATVIIQPGQHFSLSLNIDVFLLVQIELQNRS